MKENDWESKIEELKDAFTLLSKAFMDENDFLKIRVNDLCKQCNLLESREKNLLLQVETLNQEINLMKQKSNGQKTNELMIDGVFDDTLIWKEIGKIGNQYEDLKKYTIDAHAALAKDIQDISQKLQEFD